MAGYNLTRSVEELLEKTESSPPSFTVHLFPEYWTLNNGSKFLYNNQVASLLDDIRAHRIPVDFLELFDSAKVPFYEGCMIVELLDYRPQKSKEPTLEKPERTRVVLHPNSETLWADLCLLNQKAGNKWTDNDALEIEARLLIATAPPLCLDPDPHLTRIANNVLRVSTPTVPVSLKRKAAALDAEEDETDKARRAKILQFMNPRANRSHTPSYRRLDLLQRIKEGRPPSADPQVASQSAAPQPAASQSVAPQTAVPQPPVAQPPVAQPPLVQPAVAQPPTQPPAAQPVPVQNIAPTAVSSSADDAKKKANLKQAKKKVDGATPLLNQYHQNSMQSSSPSASQSPVPTTQRFTQSPQIPSSQPPPQVPASSQSQSQPQPVPTFQPPVPPTHFLNQPPAGPRNVQPKPSGSNTTPSQTIAHQPNLVSHSAASLPVTQAQAQAQAQAQMIYAHHIQQQMQAAQRLNPNTQNQNGRSTPQGPPLSHSPLNSGPNQTNAQRSSPLVGNQPLASRSPMPPNSQPVTHPPQQHLNFSVAQNQFNASHIRPTVHTNGSPHPQTLPPHLANGVNPSTPPTSQSSQDQQQAQQHQAQQMMTQFPQMFGYPQMANYQLQAGRYPPGYWTMGMGRGIPGGANGQPIPGMVPNANHPQMQLGVGKAVPGQLQGR